MPTLRVSRAATRDPDQELRKEAVLALRNLASVSADAKVADFAEVVLVNQGMRAVKGPGGVI